MDINLYETPKASQTQQSEHRGQTNAQKELIGIEFIHYRENA